MNRYRILRASPAVLLGMIVSFQDPEVRNSIGVSGLPEDLRLLRTAYDPLTDQIIFFVSSETFDVVPDGGVAKEIQPAFTREYRR